MAVTLVSTGIQFPDATIQTTAASASPITLVSSTTSTSGTYVIFTGLTSAYRAYQFVFTNVKNSWPSNNETVGKSMLVQFSNNNGSSYEVSSGYAYVTTSGQVQNSGNGEIGINIKANNRTGSSGNGTFTLWNPGVTGVAPSFNWQGAYVFVGTAGYGESVAGQGIGGGAMVVAAGVGYNPVNAVRFYWESGATWTSGTWKVFGIS